LAALRGFLAGFRGFRKRGKDERDRWQQNPSIAVGHNHADLIVLVFFYYDLLEALPLFCLTLLQALWKFLLPN
jgi:hypothetical protein